MMFISVPKSDLVLHWLQRTYKVPRDQSGLSSQTPEAEELLIVCVCVCLFTLVLWTLHNYFCLDVCYLKDWSPNKQGTVWRSAHAVVLPSRWCIANIYLPETTGSSRSISKMLLRGKRCVYICDYHFDPSPPHEAIQSTNEGRHTTSRFLLWIYTAHLELFVSFKLSGHCGGHMVPIENSLLPSGHISVSLWFKTETKRGFSPPLLSPQLLSPLFCVFLSILK